MKRIQIQDLWYAVEIRIWQDYDAYTGGWRTLKTYARKPYVSDEDCRQTIKECLPEFYKDIPEKKKSKSLSTKLDWERVEDHKYTLHPYFYWKTVDVVENGNRENLQQRWDEKNWD